MAGVSKPVKFDRNETGELYACRKLRSSYMAEANAASAQTIIAEDPYWYYGTGWYWNPWFSAYTFLPADGIYYGPFGWGFYSPIAVYWSPFIFYGHYPHRFGDYHYPYGHGFPRPGRTWGRGPR